MITTFHSHPDVLLVLLSVLGSRSTNVADLQLCAQSGARGEKGATALGVWRTKGRATDSARTIAS